MRDFDVIFSIGTKISVSPYVPLGYHALRKRGHVVWGGKIGLPIEDVDFDEIVFCREDYERFKVSMDERYKVLR